MIKTYVMFIAIFISSFVYAADYTPEMCPVVGNTKSGIYHVPGGESYRKMLIKNKGYDNRLCFKSEREAIQSGFRKSKR